MQRFLFLLVLLLLASTAHAQYRDAIAPYTPDQAKVEKPLMVIRYNQENVYYQLPLYNAVRKTLQVKPTAQFNFVSKIPFTGQPQKDQASEEAARANWAGVRQTLDDIGLPERQMTMRYESSNDITANEILVFVQ